MSDVKGAFRTATSANHRDGSQHPGDGSTQLDGAGLSTLCRKQDPLAAQIIHRRRAGPLNLSVDSTGIKLLGDREWWARKNACPPHASVSQRPPGIGHSLRHSSSGTHLKP